MQFLTNSPSVKGRADFATSAAAIKLAFTAGFCEHGLLLHQTYLQFSYLLEPLFHVQMLVPVVVFRFVASS